MGVQLSGVGKSAKVKKAKLVTKVNYDFDAIGGAHQNKSTPLSEMRMQDAGGHRLGIIFPYNPTLNAQGSVTYGQYDLTHTNYQPHFYSSTQNLQLTVGWQMTASTLPEANYMLGFMVFLRTITKMNFGKHDDFAGMPPPVLEFSSYGKHQFNNVPVVMRSYSFDQTGQEDMVDTDYETQVPTFLTGFMDIVTQYTPGTTLNKFTLQEFARGNLTNDGFI